MKNAIHNLLRKQIGIELKRTSKNPEENPIPLVNVNALRLIHLYELQKMVGNILGNIVECGVGWGRSLYALCLFEDIFDKGRHIYGFDSFKGFPEPTKEDEPELYGIKKGRYSTNMDSVIKHLLNCGIERTFVDSKVTLTKGFFEKTLHKYNNGPIALLHLDVDLYQSYKVCLEQLYSFVPKGGIIAFDEYQSKGKYSGCKKAVDEFLGGKENILKAEMIDRYYLIKGGIKNGSSPN